MVYAVIDSSRFPYAGEMPDEDDRVFYEVCRQLRMIPS